MAGLTLRGASQAFHNAIKMSGWYALISLLIGVYHTKSCSLLSITAISNYRDQVLMVKSYLDIKDGQLNYYCYEEYIQPYHNFKMSILAAQPDIYW